MDMCAKCVFGVNVCFSWLIYARRQRASPYLTGDVDVRTVPASKQTPSTPVQRVIIRGPTPSLERTRIAASWSFLLARFSPSETFCQRRVTPHHFVTSITVIKRLVCESINVGEGIQYHRMIGFRIKTAVGSLNVPKGGYQASHCLLPTEFPMDLHMAIKIIEKRMSLRPTDSTDMNEPSFVKLDSGCDEGAHIGPVPLCTHLKGYSKGFYCT